MPALGILLNTGCFIAHGGIEAGSPASGRPVHGVAHLEYGVTFDERTAGADVRVRMGARGVELAAGASGCLTPVPGFRPVDLCGRVYAAEVGARYGELTVGGLSPALGVRLWLPDATPIHFPVWLNEKSFADSNLVSAKVLSLWVGYDVRIAQPSHRSPYVGVTVGYGFRSVPKSSIPRDVMRRIEADQRARDEANQGS